MTKMKKSNLHQTVTKQFDKLNYSQLNTLFDLYQILDSNFNFFMPEENHIKLINFYFERIRIKNFDSLKSFLYMTITQYTYKSRYIDLLNIFEMINKNYSFKEIVSIFL